MNTFKEANSVAKQLRKNLRNSLITVFTARNPCSYVAVNDANLPCKSA